MGNYRRPARTPSGCAAARGRSLVIELLERREVLSGSPIPTALPDTYVLAADQTLTINAVDGVLRNDTVGTDPVILEVIQPPTQGSVSLANDGSFTYTRTHADAIADSFTYQITVGGSTSEPVAVSLARDLGTLAGNLLLEDAAGRRQTDVFLFRLTDPSVFRAEIFTNREAGAFDGVLALFNDAGQRLAFADDVFGLDPMIQLDLPAGDYRLEVSGYGRSAGSYRLAVQQAAAGSSLVPLAPTPTTFAPTVGTNDRAAYLPEQSGATIRTDSGGNIIGMEFTLAFSDDVDYATDGTFDVADVTDLATLFELFAAGGDGTLGDANEIRRSGAIDEVVYLPKTPAEPARIIVRVGLPNDGSVDDRYGLSINASLLRDADDNALLADIPALRFDFNTTPPTIESAQLTAYVVNTAPNRLVLRLSGTIQTTDALDPTAYTFGRLEAGNQLQPIPFQANDIFYDPDARQIVIGGFGSLPEGRYRLIVHADRFRSTTGLKLDGDSNGTGGDDFVVDFVVAPPTGPANALTAGIFDPAEEGLAVRFDQGTLDLVAAQKFLRDQAAAEALLDVIELAVSEFVPTGLGDPSQELAEFVNDRLAAAVADALASLGAFGGEYLVLWGRDARFLLTGLVDGVSAGQIGLDSSLDRVEGQLNGAVLAQRIGGLSVALVPVDFTLPLLLESPSGAKNVQLSYGLERAGLSPTNQAGLLLFTGASLADAVAYVDQGPTVVSAAVTLPPAFRGFDPLVNFLGEGVRRSITALTGNLANLGRSLAYVWFDPVDFVVSDANGELFRGDQPTELAVALDPAPGGFVLELSGVGSAYRGAVVFAAPGEINRTVVAGTLATGQFVVTSVSFNRSANTSGAAAQTLILAGEQVTGLIIGTSTVFFVTGEANLGAPAFANSQASLAFLQDTSFRDGGGGEYADLRGVFGAVQWLFEQIVAEMSTGHGVWDSLQLLFVRQFLAASLEYAEGVLQNIKLADESPADLQDGGDLAVWWLVLNELLEAAAAAQPAVGPPPAVDLAPVGLAPVNLPAVAEMPRGTCVLVFGLGFCAAHLVPRPRDRQQPEVFTGGR